jgi:RimJ/RimL family protein N-acetyltransferase
VDLADATFIVELRARAGRFLNRGAASVSDQLVWLETYFEREGDYYFVIEAANGNRREGLVGLYGINARREAEWGRWILVPDSNAAVESALLLYRCAFDELHLNQVSCRTLADNAKVVAFHDSCGLARGPSPVSIEHHGKAQAAIEHMLSKSDWPRVRSHLDRLASRFARRVVESAGSFP